MRPKRYLDIGLKPTPFEHRAGKRRSLLQYGNAMQEISNDWISKRSQEDE